MTYNTTNNLHNQQHAQTSSYPQSAHAMYQPGYAGTQANEVQHWSHETHTQSAMTPTYGAMSYGGSMGGASAQAMFQPGFANTNAQEVRHLNQSYSMPQQSSYMQQPMTSYTQSQASYQPSFGAQSIYTPGFAGTNVQEVQARNHGTYTGYSHQLSPYAMQSGLSAQNQGYSVGAGGIFSPGFAGTNSQEVRHLNQPNYSGPAFSNNILHHHHEAQQQPTHYAQQPHQTQAYTPGGMGAQAIFSPNFAGTNVQEVRTLNAGQGAPHTGSIFPGSF